MEIIPDQKPPGPTGEDLLGKAIFFGIIALILSSAFLYIMFPPLKTLGHITLPNGEELVVYEGTSARVDGERQHVAIIETPEDVAPEFLAALAKAHCEEALEKTRLLGTRRHLAGYGGMTVRYVQGGRYLYRFYDHDDWTMNYQQKMCTVAPYLSGELDGWLIRRYRFTEGDGIAKLWVSFRWNGRGEVPDLPMKEVCEMVVASPPRELRDQFNDDIGIVDIAVERGVSIGFLNLSSWSGIRYKRVNNLCLEIGTVEEEA